MNPRLRILELPTEHDGDKMRTPFMIIIDRAPDLTPDMVSAINVGAPPAGADACIVFPEEIDLD